MRPKLGETFTDSFTFVDGNGNKVDPTSASVIIFEDENDIPILTVAAVKRGAYTGLYRYSVACTTANGFEVDKSYSLVAIGTVGGVSVQEVLRGWQVRSVKLGDVLRATPTAADGTTYAVDTTLVADLAAIKAKTNQLAFTNANKADVTLFSGGVEVLPNTAVPLTAGDIPAIASASATSTAAGVWAASTRALTATGLDAITVTEPTVALDGPMATWNFRKLLRWGVMRMARANKTPATLTVSTLTGAPSTTQTLADDRARTESSGAPT